MYFIASRSLLSICDHKITNPESESQRIPLTYPSRKGETIYCHPTAITNFILDYFPNIKFPFILVSGDSDTTVPENIRSEVNYLLNHPLLICWYSQNCTEPSEKFKQLPIGLDFHTLDISHKSNLKFGIQKKHSWGPYQSLSQQEQDIFNLLSLNLPRLSKCYGNFHFRMNAKYGKDRIEAYSKISQSLVFYEVTPTQRINCWKNMIKYKYVISPHGNGLDCHRTWEALALGCIPIIKSSALDPMFEGLPVLIVNEWSEINQELLDNFKSSGNLDKLRLNYWKELFNSYKDVVS
jgi:hypothetical protein